MAARKTNRILAARETAQPKGHASDKAETTTLARILAAPDMVATLASVFGLVATDKDVADLGAVALADVRGRLLDVSKACAALAKTLSPEDVRVSTKDGSKAYAYAVAKAETGAVSVGVTISDAVGRALATHATRR